VLSTDNVKQMIEKHIPDADVQIRDLTGTSDHFAVRVVSSTFEGKSLIEQHKMIYAAVGEHMTREIHALQIETSIPKGDNE
jgi:stress-induced morphogen